MCAMSLACKFIRVLTSKIRKHSGAWIGPFAHMNLQSAHMNFFFLQFARQTHRTHEIFSLSLQWVLSSVQLHRCNGWCLWCKFFFVHCVVSALQMHVCNESCLMRKFMCVASRMCSFTCAISQVYCAHFHMWAGSRLLCKIICALRFVCKSCVQRVMCNLQSSYVQWVMPIVLWAGFG